MNKLPERSVEEIVKEFYEFFNDFIGDVQFSDAFKHFAVNDDNPVVIDDIARWLTQTLTAERQKREEVVEVTEDTSDGYHTFRELYEFRLLYNAHLFNEWAKQGMYDVHKSQRHADGELCFGRDDYFIVVATLPTGQISNHYPMCDWDLFQCEAVEKAKHEWDGHTSHDVANRLREALTQPTTPLTNDKE